MKEKAIYLIGAGPMAMKTLNWAREENLKVIVTDINPNAPGLKYADKHKVLSASADQSEHYEFTKELKNEFDICGVYCGNEVGAYNANKLKQNLGLNYADNLAMKTVLDKSLMKESWLGKDIITPESKIIDDVMHLKRIIKNEKGKFIIKPTLGSGSRGVRIINEGENLDNLWNEVFGSVDFKGKILIERFIEGRSIDANGIFIENNYYPAGILEKYISTPPECLPLGGNDPVNISKKTILEIHSLMEKACRAINLTEGPVKGDLILSKENKPFLLEVAPRFHGDVTTCNTLPFGTGCNPLKFLFKYFSSKQIDESLLNYSYENYAAWRVLCLPPGVEYQKLNRNVLETKNNITMVWFNPRHRKNIKKYNDTQQIPGYICAFGKNKEEVEEKMSNYCESITFPKSNILKNEWYFDLGRRLKELNINPKSCAYLE
tara:strand:+ start:6057 stop:7358 length:1302 start_codon:yes stop_codon:yes gene_type:complete